MSGRLRSTTASSVRRQAARIGSAAFLLPPGRIDPSSRRPPSTTKRSIAMLARIVLRGCEVSRSRSLGVSSPRDRVTAQLRYHHSMLVAPLGSGSAGNAYYFESDGTSILVDAGFGPRETSKRLEQIGRQFTDLRALVLTHEHYDHMRGAAGVPRKLQIPI